MFLDFVTTEFPANLQIVSGLLQTMNYFPIPKIYLGGKVDLFMEEAFNVYMEPGQLALLVFPYIKELIQQIKFFPENWLKTCVETAAFRMQHLVKCMDNLRLKAYLAFMTCTLHYVNTVFHALSFNMYESIHKDVET
uniref:Uncharacterized protein n=1 Tax=Ciona savignyi TaxID=51511 RepID=H2ZPJ2_CIOSA